MPYIYNDEDNEPMNIDQTPALQRLFTNFENRDCEHCKHKHPNGDCDSWSCQFEPREG